METIAEVWNPVNGFPDYEVSNHGRVRSLDRTQSYSKRMKSGLEVVVQRSIQGRILKLINHSSGYEAVSLGSGNKRLVHRLVAAEFLGLTNSKEVNHIDGNKKNNNVSNLECVTRLENVRHSVDTGLMKRNGEDNPSSKLTAEDVVLIRSSNKTQAELARVFGVSVSQIGRIIRRKKWAHV